uniref:Uncharacterized protein n=1 Tax=Pseudo-nitzschia australis TaxID=44445 RepID=A0A7S4ENK5_9STRA|mmetsp:Transcript_23176/g.50652  ORF Transcript_23176/g.50652 Transcript_23176/m.50652 type:complete len:825 (+) Transcript_23176:151-2625(+)|eukprot:CAMPEP_0168169248 /NCGR_PEP_ID=MMETSP0139_2-20121125/3539_1 /TAXON_ID=44445 /ORGANISM="Pseudo-nitzschia australis, Strain 10249 10 AB" /LENGTH=824 /DNA_ID=CAMNT_0008086659 /DNA_START=503 /DNA_END=2977 /DNA_ORIENTATION=-
MISCSRTYHVRVVAAVVFLGFAALANVLYNSKQLRATQREGIILPILFKKKELRDGGSFSVPEGSGKHCLQWAVVSTIQAPNESIRKVSNLRGWCLVIVGDISTPDVAHANLAAEKDNVFYLSAPYQEKFLPSSNSFGRKNIGYLFALSHGAKVLFDFDDKSELTPLQDGSLSIPPPYLFSEDSEFNRTVLLKFIDDPKQREHAKYNNTGKPTSSNLVFNPYAYMGASEDYTWPRGFPVDQLQNNFDEWHSTKKNTAVGDIKFSSIGVIQSPSLGDPDHDGVYRSTRIATEFSFDCSVKALPLLIPTHQYSPYNAQATTHLYHAFWGLYLPITVTGRVADIWRSYISQRIMKDIGLHVLYTPPIVNRQNSTYDYASDFVAEIDLHSKTTKMLNFLDAWSSEAETLPERILELWIALYKNNYIESDDVEAVREWLNALHIIDYKFPSVNTKDGATDAPLNVQPSVEDGQPYRAFPLFDINKEGLSIEGSTSGRPDYAVLKLIMITMDEWPLIKYWVMYHGDLIGFENIYIIDASTDSRCISFLRYARDILGANVIFSNLELNEISVLMNEIANNIAGSSDFIMKVDTDEYVFVGNHIDQPIKTAVSGYLSGYATDKNHPLQQLRQQKGTLIVRYLLESVPSEEVCNNNHYAPPEMFPLQPDIEVLSKDRGMSFKRVYDSRVPFKGHNEINLGGHGFTGFANPDFFQTEIGIIHYHKRCIEIEVENCMRVMVRHGYINSQMEDESVRKILEKKLNLPSDHDTCTQEHLYRYTKFNSNHKAIFLVKWFKCPELQRELYYAADDSKKKQYADVLNAFARSQEAYGIND